MYKIARTIDKKNINHNNDSKIFRPGIKIFGKKMLKKALLLNKNHLKKILLYLNEFSGFLKFKIFIKEHIPGVKKADQLSEKERACCAGL